MGRGAGGPWFRRAAALVTAIVSMAGLSSVVARAAERPLVIVYGDSLVHEARPFLDGVLAEVGGVDINVNARPGAATCDLLDDMRHDVARRPVAVVLAFSGNALTPCMRGPGGEALSDDEVIDRYRGATSAALQVFRTVPAVWLATAPISREAEEQRVDRVHRLAEMARAFAWINRRVRVAEAAGSVLADGRWTLTLPCLAKEPCTGGVDASGRRVNQVRSIDGVHFCPVPYPGLPQCPVHASGGLRYGLALLAPVLRSLDRWDQTRADAGLAAGWKG